MNGLLKRGCAALLCALLAGAPALAETDGFFSEAGMFEYLSAPTALPLKADEVAPSDGWIGTFYAPGVGLELRIYENEVTEGAYLADLYNYNITSASAAMTLGMVLWDEDGTLREAENRFVLSGLSGGSFQMTLSEDYLASEAESSFGVSVYGGVTTVAMTDASVLLASAGEDEWGGAYYHDVMQSIGETQVYDDLTVFLSLVQLYGTDDYYLVQQRVHYGQEMEDFMVIEFLTESDGALIHEYGVSIVTGEEYTVHYTPDADGNLTSDAGSDGIPTQYIRCSTKPMWRE